MLVLALIAGCNGKLYVITWIVGNWMICAPTLCELVMYVDVRNETTIISIECFLF